MDELRPNIDMYGLLPGLRSETKMAYGKSIWESYQEAMKATKRRKIKHPKPLPSGPPYKRYRPNPFYWFSHPSISKNKILKKPRKILNNPTILFRKGAIINPDGSVTVFLNKRNYGR